MSFSFKSITTIAIFCMAIVACKNDTASSTSQISKHVVVIGFDGLSPDGLKQANTPTFDKLIKEGASTMHARAVLPTSSSSNWASMIMGAGPEQHGITSNSWEKHNFILPTVTQSEDFLFPSIFHLADTQIPNAEIGAIYHWTGFGRLFEKKSVDYDINPKNEDETAAVASKYIQEKNPNLTFIHFDHVDHAGHEYGHGTDKYYKSVEKADALLAIVLESIKNSKIANDVTVIISSDHGGLGKGHGDESLQEVEVPFIIWGNAVKANFNIETPTYQYDNAATAAYILGLDQPYAWIGKPVKHAFTGNEIIINYPVTKRLPQPVIQPKSIGYQKPGGLFTDSTIVKIDNPNSQGDVLYTIDGSLPSRSSNKYTEPFSITKNTIVKAALFIDHKLSSDINSAYFRIKPQDQKAPVTYDVFYFDNDLSSIPFVKNSSPSISGHCFEIASSEIKKHLKQNTVVRFKTNISIEKEGDYKFYTRSDDGSKLWVDGKEIVNNDGNHGVKEKDGKIHLTPGVYPLEVIWYNGGGGYWLDVFFESNEHPKQLISPTHFSR